MIPATIPTFALIPFIVMVLICGWRDFQALRKRRQAPVHPSRWRVVTKPTQQWIETYNDYYQRQGIDMNASVMVKLVNGSQTSLHLATVNVGDDDYEQQIQVAVLKGEERAMTLNALAEVNG